MATPHTLGYSGDSIYVGDGDEVYGDFDFMGDSDVGASQRFSGGSGGYGYIAYGDAYVMSDSAVGGDDDFVGGSNVYSGGFYSGGFPLLGPSETSDVTSLDFFYFSGGVQFAGDAGEMYDRSVGGDDTMQAGVNSTSIFAGDALYAAYDSVVGGDDWLIGGNAEDGYATNLIMGDAGEFGYSGGGEVRSARTARESGDVTGGWDYIEGGGAFSEDYSTANANILMGDAYAIYGKSSGGSDEIHGGSAVAGDLDASALNFIVGDGFQMQGTSTGGADDLYGGDSQSYGGDAYAINFMAGDTMGMFGQARAGDDVLTGGDSLGPEVSDLEDGYGAMTLNLMAGDTFYSEGGVKFGDDELMGGSGVSGGDGYVINAMYGDTGDTEFLISPDVDSQVSSFGFDDVSSAAVRGNRTPDYGDDTLVGGDGQAMNFLAGDAEEIFGKGAKGGDDVLIAGGWGTENMLIGDAMGMGGGAKGGNDILISGEGNDMMYGDAQSIQMGGGGRGGADTIEDFRPRDRDRIDLSDFDEHPDFRDFSAFVASERMEQVDGDVVLHLDYRGEEAQTDVVVEIESNTVLIVGVTVAQLTSASFIF